MTSDFVFKNFKIDQLELKMRPELSLVLGTTAQNQEWDFSLSIRQPYFFKATKDYVGGLSFHAQMVDKSESTQTENRVLVSMAVGIAGAFTTAGQLPSDLEDRLVRLHIPAILMPFLRATVSNITASCGFGSLILPLMNMHKWSQSQDADIKVQIVEPPAAIPSS